MSSRPSKSSKVDKTDDDSLCGPREVGSLGIQINYFPPWGETELGFFIHLFYAKQHGRSMVSTSPSQHLFSPGWLICAGLVRVPIQDRNCFSGEPLLDT